MARYKEPLIKQMEGICMLCAREGKWNIQHTEVHHVLFGTANRKMSTKYGLVCNLCVDHHRVGPAAVHNNRENREWLCRVYQTEFEKTHSREEWMQIAGKNYL